MKSDRLAPWAAYCVVGVGALIMLIAGWQTLHHSGLL